MGVSRLRRRPPPVLPLDVFGEAWKKWLLDAAAAAAKAGYAFAGRPWVLYAWMIVWACAGVGIPALNSIISKQVPENEQVSCRARSRASAVLRLSSRLC